MRLFEMEGPDEATVEFINNVKRDCQPFLQQIDNNIKQLGLFRGISQRIGMEADVFVHKQVRLDDRAPRDSDNKQHKLWNNWFKKNLGEPFRNAMFATGDEVETFPYGEPYLVFPIGNFTFAWSPHVMDLSLNQLTTNAKSTHERLTAAEYQTDNLQAAILSGHEIMIRCKEYYALNWVAQRERSYLISGLKE